MKKLGYLLIGLLFLIACKQKIDPISERMAKESEQYAKTGDFKKMLDRNDQAIAIDDQNYIAFNNRATAKANLNYDSAAIIKDMRQAIQLNPNYLIAQHNLVVVYFDFKDYEKVIELGEAYLKKDKNGHLYNLVGQSYLEKKDYATAKQFLDLAAHEAESDTTVYNARGIVNRELGRLEESITDFNKAIQLSTHYSYAYNSRGITWDQLKKHDLAIADYSKAIQLDSTAANYWLNRGLSYLDINQKEKACEDFRKALALGHPNAQAPIADHCPE